MMNLFIFKQYQDIEVIKTKIIEKLKKQKTKIIENQKNKKLKQQKIIDSFVIKHELYSMSKYKYEKQFFFSQKNINDIKLFLKDKPNIDLTQVVDDKNNTVLHQSAYQGDLYLLDLYVSHMKIYWRNNNKKSQQQKEQISWSKNAEINYRIKQWVNRTNNEGFACLHYASFKGDIKILERLDLLGADLNVKTKSGLSVFHLASQTDKVKTFIYYRNKIPIDELDDRKSTPLHWAAFSGSQKVIEYILSRRAQILESKRKNSMVQANKEIVLRLADDWIDAQDIEQQTALHLATLNGNAKIVRKLLIAGANRHIKNKQGRQAYQIAIENQFTSIQLLLNDRYTCLDRIKFFFNIKIKYQPKSRSLKMPLFFLFLSFILIAAITFTTEFYEEYKTIYWIQQGCFALLIALYLSLVVPNPKQKKSTYEAINNLFLSKQNKQNFNSQQTLIISSVLRNKYRGDQINAICLRCIQYKPHRSYHCDICNTCVQQYDHHCPWINNCVGKNNIFRFVIFLVLLLIVINWIFVICIQFILVLANDENDKIAFFSISEWAKNRIWIMYIFVVINLILWLIFVMPLFILVFINLTNLCIGKTTYERFSKAQQSILSRNSKKFIESSNLLSGKSHKRKCSCWNCIFMCVNRSEQNRLYLE